MISEYNLSKLVADLNKISPLLQGRLLSSISKYTKHPSFEHTFMVLQEEVDELKQELYKKEGARDSHRIFDETLDIACVALRLIIDHELLNEPCDKHMEMN